MPEKSAEPPVRIIGSRELHKGLPSILRDLQQDGARFVLTVHGKPRAVMIAADSFLRLLQDPHRNQSEAPLKRQLKELAKGPPDGVAAQSPGNPSA